MYSSTSFVGSGLVLFPTGLVDVKLAASPQDEFVTVKMESPGLYLLKRMRKHAWLYDILLEANFCIVKMLKPLMPASVKQSRTFKAVEHFIHRCAYFTIPYLSCFSNNYDVLGLNLGPNLLVWC